MTAARLSLVLQIRPSRPDGHISGHKIGIIRRDARLLYIREARSFTCQFRL